MIDPPARSRSFVREGRARRRDYTLARTRLLLLLFLFLRRHPPSLSSSPPLLLQDRDRDLLLLWSRRYLVVVVVVAVPFAAAEAETEETEETEEMVGRAMEAAVVPSPQQMLVAVAETETSTVAGKASGTERIATLP